MSAMSARNVTRSLLGIAAAGLLFGPSSAAATETICTSIIQAGEYPIPMDEREGNRQVQGRVLPGLVAEGDKMLGEDKQVAAMNAYAKVLAGYFNYRNVMFGPERCLPTDFYQKAADKFRVVASAIAEQRRVKGHLLDETHDYSGDTQAGALRLYLLSNQYDAFVDFALDYAMTELLERDIERALAQLADSRLEQLEQVQSAGTSVGHRGLENDLTPLLNEELAAFEKLADFEETLRAHLAPLYPKITDHWLAEEGKHYGDAVNTDGIIPKGLMFGRATDALERGIKRLGAHPEEVARLKSRASARGKTLMTQEQYEPAEAYFEIAGNDELAERAGQLAETQQLAWAETMESSIKSDIEKMQKSEEEQAAFQEEADEMAAEFGFDLEE